jgi:hypothetical protein
MTGRQSPKSATNSISLTRVDLVGNHLEQPKRLRTVVMADGEPYFEVVGDDALTDEAIDALAALLLACVDVNAIESPVDVTPVPDRSKREASESITDGNRQKEQTSCLPARTSSTRKCHP